MTRTPRCPAKDAAPTPAAWKPEEIAAAQAGCTAILKDLDAVSTSVPPIREGQCGAAAPIRLTSLGKNPAVTFSPPALVDCELAGALAGWIKNDVQPLAMKHLGAKIVRIEVMSDYACRTSAGRGAKHLSEHAFANAIDIGSFVTEKGQTASVLGAGARPSARSPSASPPRRPRPRRRRKHSPPPTRRRTRISKDPAAKPDDKKAAPIAVASSLGTPAAGGAKRTRSNGIDKITITLPGASAAANDEITKLGGPKAAGARKADPTKPGPTTEVAALSIVEKSPGPQAQFLHAAHAAACRIFGTTLGPEANADHRNHFHVDMAERKYKKICD